MSDSIDQRLSRALSRPLVADRDVGFAEGVYKRVRRNRRTTSASRLVLLLVGVGGLGALVDVGRQLALTAATPLASVLDAHVSEVPVALGLVTIAVAIIGTTLLGDRG